METDNNININIAKDSERGWTILGTLLACGAVGMLAWAISNAGMLDLAATGLTFFFMQFVSMMFKAGVLTVEGKGKHDEDFTQTRGMLKTAFTEFQDFQRRSPIWRMALMAFGFTIGYLLFRWGMSVALGIFKNVWIAGAASALLASVIVAPDLFSRMFSSMKKTSGVQVHKPVESDNGKAGA